MMIKNSALCISVAIFAVAAFIWIWVIHKTKKDRLFSPTAVAVIGIAAASFSAMLPAYIVNDDNTLATAMLYSLQHTVRLFFVDDGFENIFKHVNEIVSNDWINMYKAWIVFLFIVAPVTTITAILSVFMKIWYHLKNRILFWRETYAFSELNEKTLALAKSISEKYNNRKNTKNKIRKPLIIFADILDKNEEAHIDLIKEAKVLNAILFKKDLTSIKFKRLIKRKINFYLVSDNETQKLNHAKYIIEKYDDKNVKLFLFSESVESELFMSEYAKGSNILVDRFFHIYDIFNNDSSKPTPQKERLEKVLRGLVGISLPCLNEELSVKNKIIAERRLNKLDCKMRQYLEQANTYISSSQINMFDECLENIKKCNLKAIKARSLKITGVHVKEIRFLVYQYLYKKGAELFRDATDDGNLKTVYVTVVGCGKCGEEFIKALLWFCQFPGYKIDITVIDRDASVKSRFRAKCSALETDRDINGSGDMRYRITFKNIDVETYEFIDEITQDKAQKRHFFVCLGDDSLNTRTCGVIRQERGRNGAKTEITTRIFNTNTKKLVEKQGIAVIGDLEKYYSIDTFYTDNLLIESGLNEHLLWWEERRKKIKRANKKITDLKRIKKEERWLEKQSKNMFNLSAYNFYSSISRALHRQTCLQISSFLVDGPYKYALTVADAEKYKEELEKKLEKKEIEHSKEIKAELCTIAEIEHVRWNAYMRTEGWVFGEKRNNEYKMHPEIVSVEKILDKKEEILKDV